MLRLAIAGVVVAMFATAAVNGQCGCVELKKAAGDVVCITGVNTHYGTFTLYDAKNCATGDPYQVMGPPGEPNGDCAAGGSGCQTLAPEMSKTTLLFHPKMTNEQLIAAKAFLRKRSTDLFTDLLSLVQDYVHLERRNLD